MDNSCAQEFYVQEGPNSIEGELLLNSDIDEINLTSIYQVK